MVVGKNFRIGIYLVLILFIIGSLLNRFPNSLTKDDDLTTLDTPLIPQTSSKAKTAYNKNVQALEEKEFTVDPDEKFLAYNTHSGYHNQRISLENALLLAKLLNRTLLMPPALLGSPLPWAKFDKMHERLFLSTKKGLQHCLNVPKDFPLPAECLNYNSYTTVSWDFLLNVEPIRQSQKIIDRLDHSYEWIENKLSLDIKKDVRFIKDTKLWDYRIFDVLDSDIDNSNKYARFLYTDVLKKDPHKLIYLGSLFGAFRVVPQKPSSMEYLKFIRKHLIPNNPLVLKAANSIVNKLGGVNNFVGVHIRATDGFFMKFARLNIDNIYHNLTDEYTNLDSEEINMLEGGTHEQDVLIDDSVDLGSNNPYNNVNQKNGNDNNNNESKNKRENLQLKKREISLNVNNNDLFVKKRDLRNIKCNKPLHPSDSGVNTVIFIATDIKSPRTSPLLFKFFNTFPCTFVLGDFEEDLEEISGIVNSDDLTPLTEYLIPTLDALISSKGHSFYGTEKSTFSKYIEKTLYPISRGEGLDITFNLD